MKNVISWVIKVNNLVTLNRISDKKSTLPLNWLLSVTILRGKTVINRYIFCFAIRESRHRVYRFGLCWESPSAPVSVKAALSTDLFPTNLYKNNYVAILLCKMKAVIAFVCLLALSAVSADVCYSEVSMECGRDTNSLALPSCNAVYGNFGRQGNVANELQAYANLHLRRSYEYLLSASYYNNYQTNRAGFSKLFRKLSDDAWAKTIDIIKHVTMRGGSMDFRARSSQEVDGKNGTIELQELESLAHALDVEKELAERAFFIHQEATRNNHKTHDAEIAQYLEEEFIEDHAKLVRDLAGYTSDLKQFITKDDGKDLSLSLYLFDEYLQKVV